MLTMMTRTSTVSLAESVEDDALVLRKHLHGSLTEATYVKDSLKQVFDLDGRREAVLFTRLT